jgi:hypothetical protein
VVQDTSIPLLGEVEEWYSKQVAYSVTSDIGLNVRALPSTDSEVVFRMVDGQKLTAITEHTDEDGNHWLGFVMWCCQEYGGEELAKKV